MQPSASTSFTSDGNPVTTGLIPRNRRPHLHKFLLNATEFQPGRTEHELPTHIERAFPGIQQGPMWNRQQTRHRQFPNILIAQNEILHQNGHIFVHLHNHAPHRIQWHHLAHSYFSRTLLDLTLVQCRIVRVPHTIASLQCLIVLDLSNNAITELPNAVGRLTQLRELNLSDNPITTFPPVITQLESLQQLRINDCPLQDVAWDIGVLRHLSELYLIDTHVTRIPYSCGLLRNLRTLGLYNTRPTIPEIVLQRLRQHDQFTLF